MKNNPHFFSFLDDIRKLYVVLLAISFLPGVEKHLALCPTVHIGQYRRHCPQKTCVIVTVISTGVKRSMRRRLKGDSGFSVVVRPNVTLCG